MIASYFNITEKKTHDGSVAVAATAEFILCHVCICEEVSGTSIEPTQT